MKVIVADQERVVYNHEAMASLHRYFWADLIRVVAIFLVVFVHNLFLLPKNTLDTLWLWIPFSYGYLGIPLFVMISGALLLGKKESIKAFFQKRIFSVLVPWVFWIGVYIAIEYFFYQKHPASFVAWIRYIYQMFFSRFWFLPMIFGLYLLTPIFRRMLKSLDKKILIYALVVWYFAFGLLPAIYKLLGMNLSLDSSLLRQVFQYSGLFVLGYALTEKKFWQQSFRFWLLLFITSMLSTYGMVFFTSTALQSQVDPFFYRIFSPTVIPGAIAFFMLLFHIGKAGEKKISPLVRSVVAEMSEAALGIYLVHEIVQQVIARGLPQVDRSLFMLPLLAVPVRALLVFTFSFLIIALLRRIPLAKYAT